MVVIWYALATVLEGALYAAVGGKGEAPNWVTYVGSGVPLYLIAMPIAVMLMGKSTVIETRKFDMKPGLFFKLPRGRPRHADEHLERCFSGNRRTDFRGMAVP